MRNSNLFSVILLIFFSFQSIPGRSQKLSIGIEGGAGMKFIYHKHIFEESIKPGIGFSGGAFVRYDFFEKLALKTGLSFERKGAFYKTFSAETGHYSENLNFNYLTIPILLQTRFGKRVQFFLNIGPYFGFMISATHVMNWRDKDEHYTADMTKYQKRFDIGIATGFGLEVPIAKVFFLSFEIRNNLGLFNLINQENVNSKTMNNTTIALCGFGYRIKG